LVRDAYIFLIPLGILGAIYLLIARRIVLWKKVGNEICLGTRVGLIRFGSCLEIILPPQLTVMVRTGQRVKGGITFIGKVGE